MFLLFKIPCYSGCVIMKSMEQIEDLNKPDVREPERSPMASEHSEYTEQPVVIRQIITRDPDLGRLDVRHPEIIGLPNERILKEDEMVRVVTSEVDGPIEIRFDEYLKYIGNPYQDYVTAARSMEKDTGKTDNHSLLYNLHAEVIQYRKQRAEELHKEYSEERPDRDNSQIESRTHSVAFQKIFNDLGIDDLRADETERSVDYLSGIDEQLKVDGVTIGIDRSFKDKSGDVRQDHWRYVPEHPELGKVIRIFVKEEYEDYGLDANGRGTSLTQRLYNRRAEKAKVSKKKPNELQLSPLYTVLGETKQDGMRQQQRRALQLLKQVKGELEFYLESEKKEADRRYLTRTIEAVDVAISEIRQEKL